MDADTVEHLDELVHDKKRLSARILEWASTKSGVDAETLALAVVSLSAAYLLLGSSAGFFANLLISSTIAVFIFLPEERPTPEAHFRFFCGIFVVYSVFDSKLKDSIPQYFFIKVVVHIILLLRPYCAAEKILAALEERKAGSSKREKGLSGEEPLRRIFSREELSILLDTNKKSPPPEKPEGEKHGPTEPGDAATPRTARSSARTVHAIQSTPSSAPSSTPNWPTSSSLRSVPVTPAPKTAAPVASHDSVAPMPATSLVDITENADGRAARKANPMLSGGSPYAFSPSASTPLSPSHGAEIPVGAYDLEFMPAKRIIFNAPFDYADLTYHMRIRNVSQHNVAFAVKSNAIPRVSVFPPTGVLLPGKKLDIAVTLKAFNEMVNTDRDRFSIEYVRCDTDKFSFSLLQESGMKVRKNIAIGYNP